MLKWEYVDPKEQIKTKEFKYIEAFLKATGRTQVGWHYITDLTWIYTKVKSWPKNVKILDAGGGTGPVQFLLAEMGFNVTNIDMALSEPYPAYRMRYQTTVKTLPSFVPTSYVGHILHSKESGLNHFKEWLNNRTLANKLRVAKYNYVHNRWRSSASLKNVPEGTIGWIVGNLCDMPEVSNESFDAIVSLSALEHVPIGQLKKAITSIQKKLKTNAKWAVTTSGTEQPNTWYHKPSQGYCFSEDDLKKYFNASKSGEQNSKTIMKLYQGCSYLKDNLAKFYFKSSKNGMPYGKWDPKYIPVAIYT